MTRRPVFRAAAAIAAVVAAAAALTNCGSAESATDSASTASEASGGDWSPITISHMYGETTLDAAPQRIATWGAGATDAVLALGVLPVAMPSTTYGGGDDLMYPWISDAIDQLSGQPPTLMDDVLGPLSVEKLLAADPDVLLAPNSGLTEAEYDDVTAAGIPVIAPPEQLWSTPWRDTITITGDVLGRSDQAATLVDGFDRQVAEAGRQHPEFQDVTIAYVSASEDVYYFLLPSDSRAEILQNLGFTPDPSIVELDNGESTFMTTVSSENLSRITADVVFTQVDTDQELEQFLDSDIARQMPAVAGGAVAGFVGQEIGAAISPTALSIPYFLPTLVDGLARAVEVAQR